MQKLMLCAAALVVGIDLRDFSEMLKGHGLPVLLGDRQKERFLEGQLKTAR